MKETSAKQNSERDGLIEKQGRRRVMDIAAATENTKGDRKKARKTP